VIVVIGTPFLAIIDGRKTALARIKRATCDLKHILIDAQCSSFCSAAQIVMLI